MHINKVIVVGKLGQDACLRARPDGTPAVAMRLGVPASAPAEAAEAAMEWHRVVCYGELAEFCAKQFRQGAYLYVEGRLRVRSVHDAKKGEVTITEVEASEVREVHTDAHRHRQNGARQHASPAPIRDLAGRSPMQPSASGVPKGSKEQPTGDAQTSAKKRNYHGGSPL